MKLLFANVRKKHWFLLKVMAIVTNSNVNLIQCSQPWKNYALKKRKKEKIHICNFLKLLFLLPLGSWKLIIFFWKVDNTGLCSWQKHSFLFLIGIDCWNPAFDVTPANLIKGIITEVGVLKPPLDTEVNLKLLK